MREGWEKCHLEDYIKLIDYRGRTPVKTESGVRLITAKNVKLGYLQLEPQEFIHPDEYESWMTRGIPNFGDVIFTTEAPLANVAQLDTTEKVAFAQRIIVMQPQKNKIDQTFLKYLLLSDSVRNEILQKGTGATVQGIKSSLLKKIQLYLPPLPEQHRIVAILDEAFAAIAKAKANAEQNLKNAKELFESYLQGVFEQRGDGWEEKTLGELATFRNGMNFTKSSKGEQIKIVGVKDFQNNFWVPFEALDTVTLDGKLNDLDSLREGDILAVRSNGNPQLIGRTLLASQVVGKVSHSGFTIRIRLNSKIIDPIYLCNFLKIAKTRKTLIDGGNGVGIKSLNQGSLSSLVVLFPKNLTTQQSIIQKLDALSAQTKKLEAIYQQKINDLEELKKSILQKAFSGELKTAEMLAV
ncbi:restriction endonuclease subunit S [Haliscomenobacter sp.]|uniref:restriction endonuclease subunit S n=1 Tax=Haliscomenobacter sp. TaxID=2717303 RepID=UPI003BAD99E2